ncbi:MAG: hypothetical protein AB2799_19085 [Candidatus Thiodiazotropha sp.]
MAARTKRIVHDENTRRKIRATQLINRLTDHVMDKVDMKATQVNAALGLLRKCLPDLAAVEWSGEVATRGVEEMTKDELREAIERITDAQKAAEGDEQKGRARELDKVH